MAQRPCVRLLRNSYIVKVLEHFCSLGAHFLHPANAWNMSNLTERPHLAFNMGMNSLDIKRSTRIQGKLAGN